MHFDRQGDGRISQRYFGAHTYRRTAFAGDYTGLEMQRALVNRAVPDVPILPTAYVTRLLVEDDAVFGAYGSDLVDGSRYLIHTDAVILATGGHTRIWRRTSSRRDEPWRAVHGPLRPGTNGTVHTRQGRTRVLHRDRGRAGHRARQMLDVTRDPIEIAPTAHYSMGGVWVRPTTTGRTSTASTRSGRPRVDCTEPTASAGTRSSSSWSTGASSGGRRPTTPHGWPAAPIRVRRGTSPRRGRRPTRGGGPRERAGPAGRAGSDDRTRGSGS
jgi:FAD binding domain-containing protein